MENYLNQSQMRYQGNYNVGQFPSNYSNLSQNNYNQTYKPEFNQQVQQAIKPEVKYCYTTEYINISSADRSTAYPLHYDYRIPFDTPYKNVKSVEMISAILPNQPGTNSGGNILNEPYLIVDIEEINNIEFPNQGNKAKGFSVLPLKPPTQTTGGFILPELGCIFHTSTIFKTPIKLSAFTVKIRDMQGDLYDFGSAGGSTAKAYQNSFVFKIVMEEVSRELIRSINIYS